MEKWQLQDAKNRFSEVVNKALKNGPQLVTRHGTESVVIVSVETFRRLSRPKTDLVSFFKQSPLYNIQIDLSRNKDKPREVVL
jgi:prevent-host-death family protein